MTIGCNIWMICLKLNWFFYGLSRMLQLFEFVRNLRFSVWDAFNNFLIKDATDRKKIISDQKHFLSHKAFTPFHFSQTLPLNVYSNSFVCFDQFNNSKNILSKGKLAVMNRSWNTVILHFINNLINLMHGSDKVFYFFVNIKLLGYIKDSKNNLLVNYYFLLFPEAQLRSWFRHYIEMYSSQEMVKWNAGNLCFRTETKM